MTRVGRESEHFSLHELAAGVYAVIASDYGAAIGNSGIIQLDGESIVFDTFMTPRAALDLQRAAEALSGRAPRLVVNSHHHNDHIWGNQVFPGDAQIIATSRTRALIAATGQEELEYFRAHAAEQYESYRDRFMASSDEKSRHEASYWVSYFEALVEAIPDLKIRMPNVTFDGRMTFHSGRNQVELFALQGHTDSDTVLCLRREGVVFMGDLLFVGYHPYLGDGNPLQLLESLREIGQLGATRFVPGHGPVGTRDDLEALIAYIEQCMDIARSLVEKGDASQERIAQLPCPNGFQHWKMPRFFRENMCFLCEWLKR